MKGNFNSGDCKHKILAIARCYLKEKFKNRHKILEVLVKQLAPHYETEDVNLYDELLSINDISNTSKIAKEKVIGQIDYLLHYDEISVL